MTLEHVREFLRKHQGAEFCGAVYEDLPRAAVCMLLRRKNSGESLEVLLVKRNTAENDPWSGHMAFPGGRNRKEDKDLFATLLREVNEETEIDLRTCEFLGTLDEVVPGNVSIRVIPYVYLAENSTEPRIDGREIVDSFWIPLSFFADQNNSAPYLFQRFGHTIEVPSFPYLEKNVVWGMTLRIIHDFIHKASENVLHSAS